MKRKKEHLIPLEKSRRVIYLEKRGREPEESKVLSAIPGVLSAICLLYCMCIGMFVGYGTRFFLIWGVLAIFFALCSFLLYTNQMKKIPGWLRLTGTIFILVGAILFTYVEALIVSQFGKVPESGADYLIVLGAQWKENGPSYVLQKRLDAAVEYLLDNPETQAIVSGGKGDNEPISEAEGMYGYLISAGVESDRIQMESQSTNTVQNLVFSGELFDKTQSRVVLVTNNFHMYRALKIAQKQGYTDVQGLSATSYPGMLPNNMLREFCGVLKDFVVGNL